MRDYYLISKRIYKLKLLMDSLESARTFKNETEVHETLKKIHQIQGAIQALYWCIPGSQYPSKIMDEAEEFPLPPPS